MTDYQLIRSKRRTLSICVDQEGALVVRAPMRMPLREIEAFIRQKQDWIAKKQQLVTSHAPFALCDGAQMPFLGGVITLRLADVRSAKEANEGLLVPKTGDAYAHVKKWRMQRAKADLPPRVAYWSQRTGLNPTRLSFGNAKKRWGSMNSRGEMRLNAALMHCTPEMIDYVIVHELCHLLHADHSPAFHACVRAVLPQADEIRKRMQSMGYVTALLDGHSS